MHGAHLMDRTEIAALAEGMVPFVREVVTDGITPLAVRLTELESRHIEKGEPGEVGPAGPAGPEGERGKRGVPGRDGRDAADLVMLKGWITEQVVMGIEAVFKAMTITTPDNGRTLVIAVGEKICEIKTAIPLDAGVWTERSFAAGDAVSHGGSLFIAQTETSVRPGKSDEWRLAVKRGNDGRDFKPEEKRQPEPVRFR
jgi:hypothetical protein